MTTPINRVAQGTQRALEFERMVQDQADAEFSDAGRDLVRFPHNWWLPWLVAGGLTVALIVAVLIVAEAMGPRW